MKNYTRGTIEFYDKNIDTYVKSGAIVLENKINKFIKELNGNAVLDVACGPGHDTDYLTKKGIDCLGIDLSRKMIEYAVKNFKGKFRVMDFFDLKFKENSFDGIWCSSTFIHVNKKDLDKVSKGFFKVLKNDGTLGIIVPRFRKQIRKNNDTRIFTMFYKNELERYLLKNRFKIIYSEIFIFADMKWIFVIARKSN